MPSLLITVHSWLAWRSLRQALVGSAVISCVLYGGSALGASISTANLYGICASTDPGSAVACRFYVLGAAESAELTWQEIGAKPLYCISNTVTFIDLATAIRNDIKTDLALHPDVAALSAVSSVITSLQKLYPCHT